MTRGGSPYLQCASAWKLMQCSKRPVNPFTRNPQHTKTPKHGRRLTTTHQRDTRRSGCGNGRNARNTGPSTSNRRISGITRRKSTSTTINTSTTPRPSKYPPVRGENMSKRLGGIVGYKYRTSSWHLNEFPDGSNIGSTV